MRNNRSKCSRTVPQLRQSFVLIISLLILSRPVRPTEISHRERVRKFFPARRSQNRSRTAVSAWNQNHWPPIRHWLKGIQRTSVLISPPLKVSVYHCSSIEKIIYYRFFPIGLEVVWVGVIELRHTQETFVLKVFYVFLVICFKSGCIKHTLRIWIL